MTKSENQTYPDKRPKQNDLRKQIGWGARGDAGAESTRFVIFILRVGATTRPFRGVPMINLFEKRRARVRFGALLLASGLVLLLASAAAAVDAPIWNTGVFELETGSAGANAVTDTAGTGLPDDWDRVCRKVVGSDCSTTTNAHTEDAAFFTESTGESIFTGGGSKDDLDINKWKWKNGSVPDKDELLHAFAARYTCTIAAACDVGDRYLFFGADRFDNSGDAQIGFWFLQGEVAPQGTGGGGGSPFGPDKHLIGDILVLSDFTNGGTVPTIRVFMWDPSHTPDSELVDGTLLPLAGGLSSASCGAAGTADFCANVNTPSGNSLTTAPWDFLDKSGNTGFARGELYEGGLNLTDVGDLTGVDLAGECFASFFAETRSSQSVDAVLKDFAGGEFQPCESAINTVPSVSTIAVGGTVTDTATVTGEGAGTPTGKVKFWVCSPSQLDNAAPDDDPTLCDVGGTFVDVGGDEPDGEMLSTLNATQATATSDAVTVNVVGTWCFRGEYVPAMGSPYPPATDFDSSECFTVTTLQPSIATVQTWTVKDKATLTVASGGGNLEGTLRFRLFTTSDCTGTPVTGSDQSFTINDPSGVFKETTPVTVTSANATTFKWLVEFTSTNDNHEDVTSSCGTENSVLSINNG